MQLIPILIAALSSGTSLVSATAWVAGYQDSGYTGWYINQYTDLYVGNPRRIADRVGAKESDGLGTVCGAWTEWYSIEKPNAGKYEFNCVATPQQINDNAHNNGFYVGELNKDGKTVASCHIQHSGRELCDSDTVNDEKDSACEDWIVCE